MALPPIDELMAMTGEQLDELKEQELEEIYMAARDNDHLKRLVSLQWRIDTEIKRAPNKISAMLRVKAMMDKSFCKMDDKLNELLGRE